MATLSVVMGNYNTAHLVGRAIEAIVTQSRVPDEFIIRDDASADNSVEVIGAYASKYPFIKFSRNEKNLGLTDNYKKMFDMAEGDYLFAPASDDWVLPGIIEMSMGLLEKNPQAALCTGDISIYHEPTRDTFDQVLGLSPLPCYITPAALAERIAGMPIFGCCTTMKRSIFLECGGYLPELKWHCDWFASLVMAFRHGICYIPQPLAVATGDRPGSYCFEGMKDIQVQTEVMATAIRLLKSPRYRDVLPYFIRGGVLHSFSLSSVRAVQLNSDLWDMESILLIEHPLHTWNNHLAQQRAQRAMEGQRKAALRVLEKCEKLLESGKVNDAEAFTAKIVSFYPDLAQAHLLLAKIAVKRGDFARAGECAQKARSLSPDVPHLQNVMDMIRQGQGKGAL